MDVRLSGEQQALRESVRRVVSQLGPRNVRDIADAERRAKLDAAVRASGWREIRSCTEGSEDDEPSGTAVDVAIVVEQLARGCADVPFLGPSLAAELRRLAGVAQAGAAPETVVLDSDLSALTHLDGNCPVPATSVAIDAAGTTSALILLSGPAGYDLARVNVAGVVTPGPDLTRTLRFVDAIASAPLPRRGAGLSDDSLERWSAFGLAMVCADLVGTMDGAIELACDYAKIRNQYDVPIGSFQAVQHLLADAFVAAEGSRSVALHAAWAVDELPPDDARAAAALAKAYCARAARSVCESVIQVHGGIGNTWECMAHVHLRRSLMSIELFGDVGTSLARVIKHHGMEFDHGLR
jgi:alkylation response protein AidB-like acyl-CoA dehydrogenase